MAYFWQKLRENGRDITLQLLCMLEMAWQEHGLMCTLSLTCYFSYKIRCPCAPLPLVPDKAGVPASGDLGRLCDDPNMGMLFVTISDLETINECTRIFAGTPTWMEMEYTKK